MVEHIKRTTAYEAQLNELAALLVTPERYATPEMTGWGGEVLVSNVIQLPLPGIERTAGSAA